MLARMKTLAKAVLGRQDPLPSCNASHEDKLLIRDVTSRKLTFLSSDRLALIARTCRAADTSGLPGIFIEAGCALGGSTVMIAKTKPAGRAQRVYDVFGMIPPPGERDGRDVHERYEIIKSGRSDGIGGDAYYGYEPDLYKKVQQVLGSFGITEQSHNVRLIKGLVQETLEVAEPVAFAHIDVDWYEPVKVCLQRIAPRLVVGGSIILDDYHQWSGCRTATDEYVADRRDTFDLRDEAGVRVLTRVQD